MIQRIQTIYLFISTLLIAGLFVTPIAELLSSNGEVYTLTPFSISSEFNTENGNLIDTWPIAVLTAVIALGFFISIFLYKKRVLQARLCMFNIILLIGLALAIYFYSALGQSELDAKISYSIFNISIPITLILAFISNRRIRLDNALVKSYDRIR